MLDRIDKRWGRNGMNSKQVFYIRSIARHGGVTAAAKALYISQPALSQTLRQVEAELGVQLFDREVQPMRPTYAGERFLEYADTVIAADERLERQMREIREESGGRLRLGISVQRAMQILPEAMPWFVMQYPNVSIELTEAGSASLEELVLRGQVDLALAALESTSAKLDYVLIEQETIGILAGSGSDLASRFPDGTALTLSDVRGDSFVSLRQGHSVRVVQDALFRRGGMEPHILLETDSLEVAKRVTLGSAACMLCSDIYADEATRRQGSFFPLRGFVNKRHFYACRRKNETLPRYADSFVQIVTHVLKKKKYN